MLYPKCSGWNLTESVSAETAWEWRMQVVADLMNGSQREDDELYLDQYRQQASRIMDRAALRWPIVPDKQGVIEFHNYCKARLDVLDQGMLDQRAEQFC